MRNEDIQSEGAVNTSSPWQSAHVGGSSYWICNPAFEFEANADWNGYGNPMAGHADASEIRPSSMSLIALLQSEEHYWKD